MRLPAPALVVLVGPPASGKSTWAATHLRDDVVVSSDRLRAIVGEGEHDQRAGTDAFDVLELVVERRVKRGLLTVVDTLGTDQKRRRRWVELARAHGLPVIAVVFDVDDKQLRARNKAREEPVPTAFMTQQLQAWPAVRASVADDGFDEVVVADDDVEIVARGALGAEHYARRQADDPVALQFALQIPRFTWPGGPAETADRLRAIALAAEEAGFSSLWVMDHLVQIPQVGREWEDMLESYTTLGFLAGVTERIELGVLVTGVTYRNIAHLAKIVATLDVLSGGRAWCGLGAAWFAKEHELYGYAFPGVADRFAMLEDALQLLPLMWGAGTPAFEGRTISTPAATCYPRPVRERIPIMVGGSGERRTLRLVARYADACNLFGDADTVRHKVEVLHRHCADVERDPAAVAITHLSTALTGRTRDDVAAAVDALKPKRATPESFAAAVNAGTIDDHVGRFRALADAGVGTAIVNLPDLAGTEPVERFAEIVTRYRARA
jgi:F420-dependent oxidoreductase-like protein